MSDEMDLSYYDDDFAKANVREGDDTPNGKYTAKIAAVDIAPNATTGQPEVTWRLTITGPTHVGRTLFKNQRINEQGLPYLKTDIHLCGLKVATLTEFSRRRGELVGVELEVEKKPQKNPQYSAVYFNRAITPVVASTRAPATRAPVARPKNSTTRVPANDAPPPDDDDIPF